MYRNIDAPPTTLERVGRSNKFIYRFNYSNTNNIGEPKLRQTQFFKILFYRASKKATKQKAWKERTEAPSEKCASKTK